MILTLLAARPDRASLCPSEVARAITTEEKWRGAMPTVHKAVDRLLAEGAIRLSWKGDAIKARAGPYRISRSVRAT